MESNNIVEPTPSDFLQSLKCHLSNIYPNNYNSLEDVHIPRYDEISKRFSLTFGHELQFFIRIPGVINLLGDPLKLYGHAPLCMNLDQDIVFAFAMTDKSQIVISNSQNAIFPQLTIPTDVAQKFDDENNYLNLLLAGYKAALYDSFVAIPKGLQIYISSNLPTKNGFSSSSALILGMCFTTLVANGLVKKTYQETIFENLIKYEKMVSTQIAWHHHFTSMLFNKKDNVLLPNDKKSLELPPKYNFIIAHTLTPTVMLFVSGQRQNKRLVECRIGLCMMMKKMEMKDLTKMKSLGEFQDSLGYDHEEMVQLLQDSIEKKKYKTEEIEKEFGMTIINLISDIPYANNVIESNKEYNPYEFL
jgi:galactokinase